MEELKTKGYFIMEDGTKSNDEKNLVKVKKEKVEQPEGKIAKRNQKV